MIAHKSQFPVSGHYGSRKPVQGNLNSSKGYRRNESFDSVARPRERLPEVRFTVSRVGNYYIPATTADLEILMAQHVHLQPHCAYEEGAWGKVIGECRGKVWCVLEEAHV